MFPRAAIVVAALILILAVLQYRWISQVSEAERARLRANLDAGVSRFAADLDGEIARAFLALHSGRPGSSRDAEAAAERIVGWASSSPYRRIVRGFYRCEGGEAGLAECFRFNPSTESFEPVAWPAELAELRARLAERAREGSRPGFLMVPEVEEDVPAVVAARPEGPVFGRPPEPRPLSISSWSILQLDLDYIRNELLPELARKHLGADYDAAVVARSDPGRVIYGAAALPHPDAVIPLLGIRPAPRPPGFGPPGFGAQSFGTQGFGGPGFGPQRFGRNFGPGRPGERQPIRGSGPSGSVASNSPPPGSPPRESSTAGPSTGGPLGLHRNAWQLEVRHRAGSLDAAVSQTRYRDLAISAIVLLLLSASMALVVVSTRRASRLANQQMEFVAGVSHELRTPLSVIASAADNLSDGVVAGETQVKRYGSVIRREARRLGDMVEQLLRFSGLQSGRAQYRLQPVEVQSAIQRAVAACQPDILESGVEFHEEIDDALPPVTADPAALAHCLGNLIANALKHAQEGKWISISAHAAEYGEAAVEITVADHGPGIDSADLPHIFEPFYRGRHAVSGQIKGAGLGLSLVKRMVEGQSGSVRVDSKPGEGSVFTLRLPIGVREEV
jgi:signal transduction histidine kinase